MTRPVTKTSLIFGVILSLFLISSLRWLNIAYDYFKEFGICDKDLPTITYFFLKYRFIPLLLGFLSLFFFCLYFSKKPGVSDKSKNIYGNLVFIIGYLGTIIMLISVFVPLFRLWKELKNIVGT